MAKSKFHTGSNKGRDTLNMQIQAAFDKYLSNIERATQARFIKEHLEFGTNQWSDGTDKNVMVCDAVCPHLCGYCYSALNACNKFGVDISSLVASLKEPGFDIFSMEKVNFPKDRKEALRPKFQMDLDKIIHTFSKTENPYLFMLPSSHDILPEMLDQSITKATRGKEVTYTYIGYLKALMNVGHELLITLKPRLDVVTRLCKELADYKHKIVFRFTITTKNPRILAFWETFAPDYEERIQSLMHARDQGFATTISMEPYLTDDPQAVIADTTRYASQIWLGIMSKVPRTSLLGLDITNEQDVLSELARLRQVYSRDRVEPLVQELRADPKIFWKSSIIEAMMTWIQPETAVPSPQYATLDDFLI